MGTLLLDLNFIPHPLVGTPYGDALDLAIVLAIAAYALSIITREYSWVDRLWSLCPTIYCLMVAAAADFDSPRINLMTLLVVLWSVRLTYNFAIKGGYWKGGEDYRWVELRKGMTPWQFQLLNASFIVPVQMLIVWWFTAPMHAAWVNLDAPLNLLDYLAAAVFALAFIGEAVADRQMWVFQEDKKRRIDAGESVEKGFLTTGLFQYCRHPNYFCELAMWWSFYWFAVAASGDVFNWTGVGFLALTAVFFASTRLAERISLEKYPDYAAYQAAKPRIIPLTGIGRIASDKSTTG